jgi:hypothetical protein
MSGHDGMVVMIGTLVAAALVVAVGYLFLHQRQTASTVPGTSGGGGGSGGLDAGKVGLAALGGALTAVGGSLGGSS